MTELLVKIQKLWCNKTGMLSDLRPIHSSVNGLSKISCSLVSIEIGNPCDLEKRLCTTLLPGGEKLAWKCLKNSTWILAATTLLNMQQSLQNCLPLVVFFFFLQDNVLLISKDVISKSYKTTKVKINTIKPIKKRVNEILKGIVNLKVKRAKLLYSKYNPTVSALFCN